MVAKLKKAAAIVAIASCLGAWPNTGRYAGITGGVCSGGGALKFNNACNTIFQHNGTVGP